MTTGCSGKAIRVALALAVIGSVAGGLPAVALQPPAPAPHAEVGDCAACHTCPQPTHAQLCLRVCTRNRTAEFEAELARQRGPRVVILDELENRYLPVPFDHVGHAEMAEMTRGCEVCHHYTPEGAEHPACKTCHSVVAGEGDIRMPGLKGAYHRQCMSCHREWSGETSCGVCHLPKTGAAGESEAVPTPGDLIGRMHPPIPEPDVEIYETKREGYPDSKVIFRHASHIHTYGFGCAECHQEDNCNRCHEAGRKHVQQVRSISEHHQPCAACHDVESAQRCNHCHFAPGEPMPPPFDHARTGWALNRYHKDVNCRVCHMKVPFEKQPTACGSCHSNWSAVNFDHAVTGQKLDPTHVEFDCEDCHAERQYDAPPTCDSCHDAEEGVTFPAKRPGPVVRVRGAAAEEPPKPPVVPNAGADAPPSAPDRR